MEPLGIWNDPEEMDTKDMDTGEPYRRARDPCADSRRGGGGTPQTAVRASRENSAGRVGGASSVRYPPTARRQGEIPQNDIVRPPRASGRREREVVGLPAAHTNHAQLGDGEDTPDQHRAPPTFIRKEGDSHPPTANM